MRPSAPRRVLVVVTMIIMTTMLLLMTMVANIINRGRIYDRANASSGTDFMIVGGLESGDMALSHRAEPSRLALPHDNRSPESLITRRSAMRRAWRPLPFGKG